MIAEGGTRHPLAHIDEQTCQIGDGSVVWQFASVIRGARIGMCCSIGAGAIIDGSKVGDQSHIGAGAQLHPGTRIGKQVFVGPGAIFCNDLWPMVGKTGFQYPPDNVATVVVEDGASIGAGVIIIPGVVIGKGAFVAAGVACSQHVPAGMILRRDGSLEVKPEGTEKRRMRFADYEGSGPRWQA